MPSVYALGTWTRPLDIDGSQGFYALSCPSASWCLAVDTEDRALVDAGGRWSDMGPIVPATTTVAGVKGSVFVWSVSRPEAGLCTAVDSLGDAITMTDRQWSRPRVVSKGAKLVAVSCETPSSCTAVSTAGDVYASKGLRRAEVAVLRSAPDLLFYVSCTPKLCMIVGGKFAYVGSGRSWTKTRVPGGQRPASAMSCLDAQCLVVGPDGTGAPYRAGRWVWKARIDSPQHVL